MATPQIIEHNGVRILTTAQLAESYGTDNRRISENFNRHQHRYTEGKHYFLLQGTELKSFGNQYANSVSVERASKLYLWTEKGAWLHAKSLNTDQAWEAYESLVDEYYRVIQQPPTQNYTLPQNFKEALIMLAETVDENDNLKAQIENNKDKVRLAEAVTSSDEGMLIEAAAKYMRQNGVNIGRNRLFNWLRGQGYLVKRNGREQDMPTQKAISQGLMKIHCHLYYDYDGQLKTNRQVVVTGKGLMFFINKFLHDGQLKLNV